MIPNQPTETFLEHHLGQKCSAVSYDEFEYGRYGEPISIEPASEKHPANGYQTDIISANVASVVYDKLEKLGFKLKEHFMKVEVEGTGYTILFTQAGVDFARRNEAFLNTTEETPLIRDSGLKKTTSKEGYQRFTDKSSSATTMALTYLRNLSNEANAGGNWVVDGRSFTLMGLDDARLEAVTQQLEARGISYQITPPTIDMGDMDDHGPQVQVLAVSVQHALDSLTSAHNLPGRR